MSYTLKPVYDALADIASDRSRLVKEAKIQKYVSLPNFVKVVKYAYDYNKKYNVTNVYLMDHEYDLSDSILFEYLDFLSTKNGASDEEKKNLSICASADQETIDVVNRIINKDLKCGANSNTFVKFIPDLPTFEIMTCQKDINKFLKLASGKDYYWSNKKDGVRVINKINEDNVEWHLSRSGLEYVNFSIFDKELIELASLIVKNTDLEYPILIDGEAISSGKNFNNVMTQIRKIENTDLSTFKLHIFDIPCSKVFSERYKILDDYVYEYFKRLELVEHHLCNFDSQTLIDLAKEIYVKGDVGVDEGIVIKIADSPYVFKEHSKYWCKVKPTDTLDLPVTGFYFGKEGTRLENVVGGLKVDFRGVEVHVGSGLSDEQRLEFLENLPTLVEVEFKEITPDGSLREPILKRIRDDKNVHD